MRRSFSSNWWVLAVLLAGAACSDGKQPQGPAPAPTTWEKVCIDSDKDGFGVQCASGPDCDDTNPEIHQDCGCSIPNDGCDCENGIAPVDCVISREFTNKGSLLCNTGKRYCRDSVWTECLGTRSFEVASPAQSFSQVGAGLINQDGGDVAPDPCRPDRFVVEDDLLEVINDDANIVGGGGSLTLVSATAGNITNPDALDPSPPCTPGVVLPQFNQFDNDCDGIPDNYDNNVGLPGQTPPFATSHSTITMDLAPGEEGSNTFELQFKLNTVDVYFLLDTTASMDGELNRLITDLTTGTFLDNPATVADEAASVVCASPYGTTTSDASLKTKGITGNIACLVPNSGFGAGYFREIPFDNPDASGNRHAYDWFIPYEHRQDISTNVNDTLVALKKFYTTGNQSWAEDDMFALSAVATGAQIYTGWDRPGIEARTCPDPATQYGWPCFRKEAIPMVVLITDASMMNGPDVDVYKNNTSSCFTSSPFTTTTTNCTYDAMCDSAYPGLGAFCTQGKCRYQNAISAACAGGDGPDGRVGDNYSQLVNYQTSNTNTMAQTPDATYHPVPRELVGTVWKNKNEDYATAYDVGDISGDPGQPATFMTYVGDTRGMTSDIYSSNLGTVCAAWPTTGSAAATSPSVPGYPDAVFKFHVSDSSKLLTISTAGSNHAPTLAIISQGAAAAGTAGVSTKVTADPSSDTTPWSFSATPIAGAFDYSIGVDLSGFGGSWPRTSFGECMTGSPDATDYASDAVFSFTPSSDMDNVSFTTGASQLFPTSDATANTVAGVNFGTVVGHWYEYYGTTAVVAAGTIPATTSKWNSSHLGAASCRANGTTANYEHVFKFTLDNTAKIQISLSAGGTFDPVLSLFGTGGTTATPVSGSNLANPNTCARNNSGSDEVISGTYAAGTYYVLVHAYNTTNSTGTYTLNIKEQTDEAIALYDSAPSSPISSDITGPVVPGFPAGAPNTNDVFYDFNVGQIDGRYLRLNNGNTAVSTIHPDYVEDSFKSAQGTCSNVSGLSNDAIVEFSVNQTRTVRVETFDGTGLDPNQQAGFDHVVALVERPAKLTVTPTAVINNDAVGSAIPVESSTVPTAEGDYSQFTGATYGNSNTLPMSPTIDPQEMYNPANTATTACSLVDATLQDSIFKFTVDAANQGLYNFDTIGSQSTTFLSLHKGSPDTFTSVAPTITPSTVATNNGTGSSSPSGPQTGVSLGTVDEKTLTYSGSTDSTTSNKWTDAQYLGCRLAGGDAGREHVFNFTVAATRTVTITLTGTSPYDASVALFTSAPNAGSTQSGLSACSRVSTTAAPAGAVNSNPAGLTSVAAGVITGSLTAGTYYLVVHGYQNSNNTGSYALSVADVSSRLTRTVTGNDAGAGGAQIAGGVDLGDVSGKSISYTGTTTTSTPNKWTAAQAGTGNGCRSNSSQNGTREHVVRFSVSGSSKNLSIKLTRSATWEPVITVLNAAPTVDAAFGAAFLGCQRAYSTSTSTVSGLSYSGNSSTGATITGSFAVGTYYLVINGYTTDAVGTYALSVTDTAGVSASPYFTANSKDSLLNGTTTNEVPIASFGTFTASSGGGAYEGTISSSTAAKWTGDQVATSSGNDGCRSGSSQTRREHVFSFTLATAGTVAISVDPHSTWNTVVGLYGGASGSVPVANTNIPSPITCNNSGGDGAIDSISGTYAAGTYYIVVSGRSSNTYGTYDLTVGWTPTAAAGQWAANSQDTTLNSASSGITPFVDLGDATSTGKYYAGTTSGSTPTKWTGTNLGAASCRSAAANTAPEHVFRFNVTAATSLNLLLTSNYDSVLSVFGPSGSAPTVGAVVANPVTCGHGSGGTSGVSGTFATGSYYVVVHAYDPSVSAVGTYALSIASYASPTLAWANNAQDTTLNGSATSTAPFLDLGTLNSGRTSAEYSGTTSASTPTKWTGSQLGSASCRSNASNLSPEHVFTFTLTGTTEVSLGLTSSYDSVLSLIGPLGSTPSTNTTLSGTVQTCNHGVLGGSLYGSYGAGTYYVIVHSYDPTVSASGTYSLALRTAVSSSSAKWAANNQDSSLNGAIGGLVDFGTLTAGGANYHGQTTSSTPNRWTRTQLGAGAGEAGSCRASSGSDSVHEHVFKFTLGATTDVTIDLEGDTGTYDPVVSLIGPATSLLSGTSLVASNYTKFKCDDDSGVGRNSKLSDSLAAGTYYVIVHAYQDAAGYGPYSLNIRPTGSAQWTNNDRDSTLNGSSSPYADFGTLGTSPVSYTGRTTSGGSGTVSKWTSTELGGASCRDDSSQNRREHVFRFYVGSTTNVTATLSRPDTSDFDRPVLSWFGPYNSTTAPVQDTTVSNPIDCDYTPIGSEVLSGSLAAGYYFVMVHGYGDDDRGRYTLTLAPGAVSTFADNSKDAVLDQALNTVPVSAFGTLASSGLSYTGTTTAGNSKWTGSNLGSGSCRSGTSVASYEHVFSFVLSSGNYVKLNLNAGFDSALSLFGASSSAPLATTTVANPFACNRTSGADDVVQGYLAAGTYYVVVHGYSAATDRGTYTLTLSPFVNPAVAAYTANTQNTTLDYAPPAPTADFGAIGTTPLSYTGLTDTNTVSKWSAAQLGAASCRSTGATSREHLFKFTVSGSAKTITLKVASSYDSVLSVFGATGTVPPQGAAMPSPNTCIRTSGGDESVTASFPVGTYYVMVHGYTSSDAGTYTLSLTPHGAAPSATFTANSQNTTLNTASVAPYADFGVLGAYPVSYSGTTTVTTPNKWSATQLGTASCRTAGTTPSEHVFRFELSASANVGIRLNATFDSVLSLFGSTTTTPLFGVTMSTPNTCNHAGTSTTDDTLSGTLAAGTYWVVVHGYTTTDRGNYTITLTPPTVAPSATWGDQTQDSFLNTQGTPYADFGTLGTTGVSYTGNSGSGTNKWSSTNVATGASANGCRADSSKTPPEHLFRFTLAATADVSIALTTGFNPVLTLFGPSTSVPATYSNVANPVACYHDAAITGSSTNGAASLSGTYAAGTYYVLVHGYNTSTSSGGTYTLSITQTVSTVVTTDNTGAESTTASPTSVDLGTVDNYITTYTGATSATTTPNKWTNANVRGTSTGTGAATGCRASTTQNNGREHLLKFTVAAGRSMSVKLTNGTLDGVLSVYKGTTLPTANTDISTSNPLQGCSHASGTASDAVLGSAGYTASAGTLSGTYGSGTYYVVVHGYSTDAAGTYTLTITDTSVSYTSTAVTGDPNLANGSGPQSGVFLGVADSRAITYAGDTTGAANKWSQANLSSSGNTGCRASGNDVGREHVMRFTVSSARRLALRLSRPTASTYQPVLSVFNGGAPVVGADVAGLVACTRLTSTAPADNIVASAAYTSSDGLITGTFPAGSYYAIVHGYQGTNNQGAYTLQVLDASPENLGVATTGHRTTIDGDTTTGSGISFNQWRGSDFGVTNGDRFDATQRTSERLYSFSVVGTAKTLTVSVSATFDSVLSVFNTLPLGGAAVSGLVGSDHSTGTYARSVTGLFDPGTYYVLVHGYRSSTAATGAFTLSVGDDTWSDSLLSCDSRGTASKLVAQNLTPGEYYIVVKSGVGTGLVPASYKYVLNIRHTFNQPFIACDYEGFGPGSRRGFVETTVQGGKTYAVVVRGVTAADAGTYGVIIRDMTAGTAALGCANSAGYTSATADPNGFTADLTAGRTYYVAVRANSSSSVGQANVRIANFTTSTCAFNNVTFDAVGNTAGSSTYVPSKIVTRLPVGDYYAVVKGNQNMTQSSVKIPTGSTAGIPDDRGRGRYQITFGDASLAQTGKTFSSPQWGTSTSGVYADLLARGIRVLTVNSLPSAGGSADIYMREQSKVISTKTGALDRNGAPIRRSIGADGSGMGFAIVDAVAKFTDAVQMDIAVRLSLSPDDPGAVSPFNRRFKFVARAVPAPSGTSNGCGAPIDTTTPADGILDTHTACGPGATPRFEIQLTNPAVPNNVPLNPADSPPVKPMGPGGYLMTLQLIGKDRLVANAVPQIVDEVPVYVIPTAVFPDPDIMYQSSGTYTQTVSANGCAGREVPTWKAIRYQDDLPVGTALEWRVCAGDDDAELATCEAGGISRFVTAARVTSTSGVCTVGDPNACPNGFCNAGRCEFPVGPSCVTDGECGYKGTCNASSQCVWTADPWTEGISLQPAIAQGFAGKKLMRVQAKLESNAARSAAPTLNKFTLDYDCAQQE